jgi:hypothetical protein
VLVGPREPLAEDRWQRVGADAVTHRLEGLMVDAVASSALPVTDAQSDQVAEMEIDLTHARMWQEQRLVEVVDLLESAGMAVRVLKGLAVATLDYPDAQMRPTGDVDLLVRAEDLERAGSVIEAVGGHRTDPDPRRGYSTIVGKGATYATDAGEIDLHRLLVWGPLGVRLDPGLLWERRRTFVVGARELTTLSLEDTLLHACCHLLVLGARRALQLRDVAQLVAHPEIEPERVLARARQWGAEAVLATSLILVREELDQRGDGELARWAGGYPVTWRDRLWLRVECGTEPWLGLEAVATFVELPGREARLELARATLRPAPGTWPSPPKRVYALGRRISAKHRNVTSSAYGPMGPDG